MSINQNRRFGGVARLYGQEGLEAFARSHVMVVGLGGVGSWAAEALARTGVGHLTLVDFDHIAESNVNRQLHALEHDFGQSKIVAMQERLLAINPHLKITLIDDFLSPENLATHLEPHRDDPLFVVLDAMDDVKTKIALTAYCHKKIALVLSGGAGGKLDPTRVKVDDLTKTTQDPMLSKVRYALRKQHGFPVDPKKKFAVLTVYSDEPMQGRGEPVRGGLACAGYGSAVTVTSTFGMAAAATTLKLLKKAYQKQETC